MIMEAGPETSAGVSGKLNGVTGRIPRISTGANAA